MPDRREPAMTGAASESVLVAGISKRYPLFSRRRDRLLALAGAAGRLDYKSAVEDVSFALSEGEAFAVIGENGSGKSSLLRVIAGISVPDSGTLRVAQPVAAILELGLGFHPEFTGRENARLYGTLIGLDAASLDERLESIIAFADIGAYIDLPLRTYSSGMAARLAFAVATHVDARVLVVDEALAVGDAAFQKKCVDRMIRFKEQGNTVLFCSHVMYLVTSFCERALWLRDGRVERIGRVDEVVEAYETYLMQRHKRSITTEGHEAGPAVGGGQVARLRRMSIEGPDGRSGAALEPGQGVTVTVEVETVDPSTRFHVGVAFEAADGRCVFAAGTHYDGLPPLTGKSEHRARLHVASLPLTSGSYLVSGFLLDDSGVAAYDQVALQGALRIEGSTWTPSMLRLDHEWESSSWP